MDDWELDRLRREFPGWKITTAEGVVIAAKGGRTLTGRSAAVLRVRLAEHESMPVSELSGLIHDYRDHWEITRSPFGGYQAQRRPRRADSVLITADTAAEMRELLGPTDDARE